MSEQRRADEPASTEGTFNLRSPPYTTAACRRACLYISYVHFSTYVRDLGFIPDDPSSLYLIMSIVFSVKILLLTPNRQSLPLHAIMIFVRASICVMVDYRILMST